MTYWEARVVDNGPLVPISMWEEGGRMMAAVAGEEVDPILITGKTGKELTRAQYIYRVRMIDWCRKNKPMDPRCRPFEPVPPKETQVERWNRQKEERRKAAKDQQ